MAQTVNQYKIYCNTESTYVTGWGTIAPTTCYNNTGHTVNTNSVQIINTVQSNEVVINQENNAPANRFYVEALTVSSAGIGTTTASYTFNASISLYSLTIAVPTVTFGDKVSLSLNPNTPLGLITANVTAGDLVINVSSAVTKYIFPNMYIKLSDGTNTDANFKVISQNLVNNQITLLNPITNNYSSTNTQIYLTYYAMYELPIVINKMYKFGSELINARNVPAGSVARVDYYNADASSKNIVIYFSGLI